MNGVWFLWAALIRAATPASASSRSVPRCQSIPAKGLTTSVRVASHCFQFHENSPDLSITACHDYFPRQQAPHRTRHRRSPRLHNRVTQSQARNPNPRQKTRPTGLPKFPQPLCQPTSLHLQTKPADRLGKDRKQFQSLLCNYNKLRNSQAPRCIGNVAHGACR